jgi:biopolymer transport protein ExbD
MSLLIKVIQLLNRLIRNIPMRNLPEINTGSMADIAFLLLIFFLVTTNIDQDYGISSTIAKPFEVPDSIQISQSSLWVNEKGTFMINEKEVTKTLLSTEMSKTFDKKKWVKNVLLVKSDREVVYESFLIALDESKKAFKLFQNDCALQDFGKEYSELSDTMKVQLQLYHPVALAENVID